MNCTNIYVTAAGWIYEVYFAGRVIVVGCCATHEAATLAAVDVYASADSAVPATMNHIPTEQRTTASVLSHLHAD